MDKLNKWYLDSSWATKKLAMEQIRLVKSVSKEFGLKSKIKILFKDGWYNVHVKNNKK